MKNLMVIMMTGLVFVVGCSEYEGSTAGKEQEQTEERQEHFLKVQPAEKLDWSLERDQINKRIKLWNNPNKVSYIYLVSFGKVMAFYTIKGKVSSVNSQITNPQQLVKVYEERMHALPSPAEDGSYGTNGDAVYFFTTDGTYVEWRGDYMLCDKPLKLSTPPLIVREIK